MASSKKKSVKKKISSAKRKAPVKKLAKKAVKKIATQKKAGTSPKKKVLKAKTSNAKKKLESKSRKTKPQKKTVAQKKVKTTTNTKVSSTKKNTKAKSLASNIIVKNSVENQIASGAALRSLREKPTPNKLVRNKSALKIEKKVTQAKPPKIATPGTIPSPSTADLKSFRKAAKETKKRLKAAEKAEKKRKGFLAKPPSRGKKYSVDLRVHSPGTIGYFTAGGVEPGPALVRLAKVKGLDMVGLTDYYNPSYIDEVQSSAEGSKMTIIPGMDMCCKVGDCEEVYVTALFPEVFTSLELEEVLLALDVPVSARGRKDYCLKMDFHKVLEVVETRGGVVIPSRLDKTPYRQLAIPALVEEYGIHAFDLVHPDNPEFFKKYWPSGGFTFFSFSNAHALAQIGSRAKKVKLENPGFAGLKELVKRRSPAQPS